MKFKWKPQEIFNKVCEYLEKQPEDKEIIVFISNKETKEIRTATQNSMFYWLFTEIWNHLWEKPDDVKMYFLAWCFWTKKIKISKQEMEINNICHTSELEKEQAIFFIDTILRFIEIKNIPCKYIPRELQSLYDSYN